LERRAVRTPEEIEPLPALFRDAAKQRAEPDPVPPLTFFLVGVGGTVFALVVFDFAWQRQFRSVRRRLVEAAP
jgi:hypothetical protein